MKKLMSNAEMDRLIECNLKVMHAQWGSDLSHHHCAPSSPPDAKGLSKEQFFYEWVIVFDDRFARDKLNFEHSREVFLKFSFEQLDKAFRWAFDHFLEFDLGGNMAWYGAVRSIAVHVKGRGKQPISLNFERKLKTGFILETRWASEVLEVFMR